MLFSQPCTQIWQHPVYTLECRYTRLHKLFAGSELLSEGQRDNFVFLVCMYWWSCMSASACLHYLSLYSCVYMFSKTEHSSVLTSASPPTAARQTAVTYQVWEKTHSRAHTHALRSLLLVWFKKTNWFSHMSELHKPSLNTVAMTNMLPGSSWITLTREHLLDSQTRLSTLFINQDTYSNTFRF